jgi:hypothetical protein
MPDGNYKRGIWEAFYCHFWRFNGDSFDHAMPQRWVVVAKQDRAERASHPAAKITCTKADNWRTIH